MVKVHLIGPASAPGDTTLQAREGRSLMKAAVAANRAAAAATGNSLAADSNAHAA